MEVRSLFCLVFLFLISTACAPSKKTESVFKESSDPNYYCPSGSGVSNIENRFLVVWENGAVTVESAENKEAFINNFLEPNLDKIKHVEFDKIMKFKSDAVSTAALDPDYHWAQSKIQAESVWAQGLKGEGVIVGVVDAAIDYNHPQLKPNLLINQFEKNGTAGVDDDGNGLVDDVYGWDFFTDTPTPELPANKYANHGSHVAGIIAADHDTGIAKGVAPKAKIVAANFMAVDGEGSLSKALLALNYVAARGARVINASWGGECITVALEQAFINLSNQGVLLVAAAGNGDRINKIGYDLGEGTPAHPTIFPAGLNVANQITVSATTPFDAFTLFSNYSTKLTHIAAPGESILSTVIGGYVYMSGTSMAAPIVSGGAAVLFGLRPQATAAQIKLALMNSVDKGKLAVAASGRLNLAKAVEELKKMLP